MWKRHSNNNQLNDPKRSRRKISNPILIETTFDEKQWLKIQTAQELNNDGRPVDGQYNLKHEQQEQPL